MRHFICNRLGATRVGAGSARSLRTRRCERLEGAVLYTTGPDMLTTAEKQESFARLARNVRMVRYGGLMKALHHVWRMTSRATRGAYLERGSNHRARFCSR